MQSIGHVGDCVRLQVAAVRLQLGNSPINMNYLDKVVNYLDLGFDSKIITFPTDLLRPGGRFCQRNRRAPSWPSLTADTQTFVERKHQGNGGRYA